MGVKTKLTIKDLPKKYQKYKLIKSKDGVSDTVYFLDNKYVVKMFENNTIKNIQNEISLLKYIKKIKVPQVDKVTFIKSKPTIIYKKAKGKKLNKIKPIHIKKIARFLKQFHKLTRAKNSKNEKIFLKPHLKKLVKKINNKAFLKAFNNIDIKLKNDGIIHGDLFVDNANFKKDKLCCVYDFGEACNGDFLFDLAVVSISWCKTKKDIKTLLNSYGTNLKYKKFKSYINYALLYYSVTRYLNNRDHQELFRKIDCI